MAKTKVVKITNPSELPTIPVEMQKLEDIKKLPKAELVKMVENFVLPLTDPEKYKEMVKSKMPELVQQMDNKEDVGTAMFESAQEMMLAVSETLRKYHGFDDDAIRAFMRNLKSNLTVVEKIEDGGLSMLSDHSMRQVVDMVEEFGVGKILQRIAQTRYKKGQAWRLGEEVQNQLEGSKVEKQLQKPRE